MAHLIISIILGIAAYLLSAASWTKPQGLHVLIGLAVGLIVYFGTNLLV